MLFVYDLPVAIAFVLFIVFIVLLCLGGLFLFYLLGVNEYINDSCPFTLRAFISIISLFVGMLLSFLIVTVWNGYTTLQSNNTLEAVTIYKLYKILVQLPDTEYIRELIREYLYFIVNTEFPKLQDGSFTNEQVVTNDGAILMQTIQDEIYKYVPQNNHDEILYNEALVALNGVLDGRVNRLRDTQFKLYDVLWWVAFLDAALLILLCYGMQCQRRLHYILVAIAGIYVSTALFILLIMAFPFRSVDGLSSESFRFSLYAINESIANGQEGQLPDNVPMINVEPIN